MDANMAGGLSANTRIGSLKLDDLALLLGGDANSFTGELLRLVAKADPDNRERLRLGFPRQVEAWELWMDGHECITAGQLLRRLDDDLATSAHTAVSETMIAALRPMLAQLHHKDR